MGHDMASAPVEVPWYLDPIGVPPPEAAPATSDATVVSTYPSFYQYGGCVAGQDIIALESSDAEASRDVFFNDFPASHGGARLTHTSPPAPGPGVKSGAIGGGAWPDANMAGTVLVDGEPCVRDGTTFLMSCAGPEGTPNTTGKMVYETKAPDLSRRSEFLSTLKSNGEGIARGFFEDVRFVYDTLGGSAVAAAKQAAGLVPDHVAEEMGGWADAVAQSDAYAAIAPALQVHADVMGAAWDHFGPDLARSAAVTQGRHDTIVGIYEDPWLLWDAVEESRPVQLVGEGRYGDAFDNVAAHVVTAAVGLVFGSKLPRYGKQPVPAKREPPPADIWHIPERPDEGVEIPLREKVAEGTFSEVARDGDDAIKRIKSETGTGRTLTDAQRTLVRDRTVGGNQQLFSELPPEFRDMIVPMSPEGAFDIRQKWVDGVPLSSLPFTDPAYALFDRVTDAAKAIIGGRLGSSLFIDPNPDNFLMTSSGSWQWIDPVATSDF